jgi:hypothetical protein
MSERYTSGAASITVDDAALVRHVDRVSQGAASQFIDVASKALDEVKTGAMARWPVRTGSSRDGFNVRASATGDLLKVGLYNDARMPRAPKGYAWFIRFSVRGPEQIEAEMRTIRRLADEADAHVARVTHRPQRRRLFREKIAELAKQTNLSAKPFGGSGAEVVKNYAAEMADRHGQGAPTDLQGKVAWTKMVRSPARKAAPKVIETLREQLTRLAREA